MTLDSTIDQTTDESSHSPDGESNASRVLYIRIICVYDCQKTRSQKSPAEDTDTTTLHHSLNVFRPVHTLNIGYRDSDWSGGNFAEEAVPLNETALSFK